jgi:hypothetical protein
MSPREARADGADVSMTAGGRQRFDVDKSFLP